MVTRRRYKARADHAPVVADAPAAPAQAPPVAPEPTAEDDASPLQAALRSQQHAEALQHQHATRAQAGLQEPALDPQQRQQVDAHVDGIAGLSPHWRRFLKSHPSLLMPPFHASMMHHYKLALNARVPDSTAAMDSAILAGVARDIEHHRQLSQLTSANHQAHQDAAEAAAELAREAEMHLAAHQPAPMSIAPPQQRRSIPVSAPPSRESPSVSGQRDESNTLRLDEREIAHVSFPHLPKLQAEYAYLQNKRKMFRMKANGEIQGDR